MEGQRDRVKSDEYPILSNECNGEGEAMFQGGRGEGAIYHRKLKISILMLCLRHLEISRQETVIQGLENI